MNLLTEDEHEKIIVATKIAIFSMMKDGTQKFIFQF